MVRVPNPAPSKREYIKINGKKVKASAIKRPDPTPAPPPPPEWYIRMHSGGYRPQTGTCQCCGR